MKNFFKSYADIFSAFRLYGQAYGGFASLIKSPYLHLAILVTVASKPWHHGFDWIDDCLAIVPSILGFSLGAFAIFLAFSDSEFLQLITSKLGKATEKASLYLQLGGAFAHFMLVQTLAIFLALICRNLDPCQDRLDWPAAIVSAFGYFCFMYAVLTVVATAFSLLRFASIYNKYRQISDPNAAPGDPPS